MANTIELNVKARADSTEITKLEQELEKAKQKLDEIIVRKLNPKSKSIHRNLKKQEQKYKT